MKITELEESMDNSIPEILPENVENFALNGFSWEELEPYVNSNDRGQMKRLFKHYKQERSIELTKQIIKTENNIW